MKKALLLFLLIIPLTVFSQSKKSIDGFLDIPFGSDSATVKNAIAGKGGIKIDSLSGNNILAFTNFVFSERKVLVALVKFVDNKAFEADFIFSDFLESNALDYYDNLSSDINSVYGKGVLSNNFGDLNNTSRIHRLISGNAFCKSVWQSKNKNTVGLEFQSVDQKLQIILRYQDDALTDLSLAKRRTDF